jgi:hypothetical protein
MPYRSVRYRTSSEVPEIPVVELTLLFQPPVNPAEALQRVPVASTTAVEAVPMRTVVSLAVAAAGATVRTPAVRTGRRAAAAAVRAELMAMGTVLVERPRRGGRWEMSTGPDRPRVLLSRSRAGGPITPSLARVRSGRRLPVDVGRRRSARVLVP